MHENDVELHSDEDEEFETTALEFRDKFRQLDGKFREILLQESTVSVACYLRRGQHILRLSFISCLIAHRSFCKLNS